MITIYTDGSCSPNPGKGGWAYIALTYNKDVIAFGKSAKTTNNIMELTAVIKALKDFSKQTDFLFCSDSLYVINCAQGKWKRKKNIELWKKYDKYSQGKNIQWKWVKGHASDKYNNLVDAEARKAIDNETN